MRGTARLHRLFGLPAAVAAGSLLMIGGAVAVGTTPDFAANPTCGPMTGSGPGLGSHHDPLADPIRMCGEGQGVVSVPASGDLPITVSIFETYPGHQPLRTTFSDPSYLQIPYQSMSGGGEGLARVWLNGVELSSKAGNQPTVLQVEMTGLPQGMVQLGNFGPNNKLWLYGYVFDQNGGEIFLHYTVSLSAVGQGR
jgi:hypothetical protein